MDLIAQELGEKLSAQQVAEITGLPQRYIKKHHLDVGGMLVDGKYLFYERTFINAIKSQYVEPPDGTKYKKIKNGDGVIDEHRLVMEQFVGRKLRRGEIIHHINGNKGDNRLCNLQLMPLSEHSLRHYEKVKGELVEMATGENNHKAVLNNKKVRKIRNMAKDGVSVRRIADKFGIGKETARKVIVGITWKHVSDCE